MFQIDWPILINWFVAGLIGSVFGALGSWATYRLERKRDDMAWERDRKKQLESFAHEQELLEMQFQQRLIELELQHRREQAAQTRQELLKGIENPLEAIEVLHQAITEFNSGHPKRLLDKYTQETDLLLEIEAKLVSLLSNYDSTSLKGK